MRNALKFFLLIVFASISLASVVPAQAQQDSYGRPIHHVHYRSVHHAHYRHDGQLSRHELERRHEMVRHDAARRSY